MDAVSLLGILGAINQLLVLLKNQGIGWQELQQRMNQAEAEGRIFGLEDLMVLQAKDDVERAKLDAAIAAARGKQP